MWGRYTRPTKVGKTRGEPRGANNLSIKYGQVKDYICGTQTDAIQTIKQVPYYRKEIL